MTIRTSAAIAVILVSAVPLSRADASSGNVRLRWIPGSTVKVEQMIGDCDYSAQARTGTCVPTTSQSLTLAKVRGTDLGSSFESGGKLVFLFGDTLGPAGAADYYAADTIATTTSTRPEGLFLEFLTNADGSPWFIRVPGVRMGAAEVPEAGIRIGNQTYIACKSGTDVYAVDRSANTYSVLTRFDETARRFTLLRTISSMPNGRFISMALHDFGSDILMFGLSAYRASNVYLASVPADRFATGEGTRYFTGLVNGEPEWSLSESDAAPVVVDDPLEPTIGNVSVAYSSGLGLWLMTYDGGVRSPSTVGVYFTYAREPWGPWSEPQLIFNPRRDGALGTFIHDPGITPNPPGDGLNGPTIGPNDPFQTRGASYGPFLIERFTRVTGNTLSIFYTISTWNPYTVVEMRSDFAITSGAARKRAVRH